jgi:hypothetical protein
MCAFAHENIIIKFLTKRQMQISAKNAKEPPQKAQKNAIKI